jgi:hypothetical protein
MKIQTLNKTQQKRLLSLCKEFLTEYKYFSFDEQSLDIGSFIKGVNNLRISRHIFMSKFEKAPYDDGIFIHWYQLCLTELPKRIWNKVNWKDEDIIDFEFFIVYYLNEHSGMIAGMLEFNQHPVDFLWDFVQECKKNKYFKN